MRGLRKKLTLLLTVLLSACGGGGDGAVVSNDIIQSNLPLEEYIMQFIPGVDLVGPHSLPTTAELESIAANLDWQIAELNQLPMQSLGSGGGCRFFVYASEGAVLELWDSREYLYFDDGGRLSGGFDTRGTGLSGGPNSPGAYYHRRFNLLDDNGKEIDEAWVALETDANYGPNIVANVTRFTRAGTVERILQLLPCGVLEQLG